MHFPLKYEDSRFTLGFGLLARQNKTNNLMEKKQTSSVATLVHVISSSL